MARVRKTISVHEKTVQKVAQNAVATYPAPRKRRTSRPRNTRVQVTSFLDDLDPLVLEYISRNNIPLKLISVVSSTEIVIHNPKD